MSKAEYNHDGFVRGFSYHDGFLECVLADDRNKKLHLGLRAVSGEQHIITLQHVVALQVQNFREGNIVLNLRILPRDRVLSDDSVRLALKDRLFLDAANLPDNVVVFLLESSFGADIIAVCRDLDVCEGRLTMRVRFSRSLKSPGRSID